MSRPEQQQSATSRYVDYLERQVDRVQPLRRLHWGHLLGGAFVSMLLCLWFGLYVMAMGRFNWWLAVAISLAAAVPYAIFARWYWNRCLALVHEAQRRQVRSNLIDHDLLLVCVQDELPARFECLRFVAQSYGKTRARNWNELQKGSMKQRVTWLVENYYVVCDALRLPGLSAELLHERARLMRYWWPIALVFAGSLLSLFFVQWLPKNAAVMLVLFGVGLSFVMLSPLVLCFAILQQIQQSALVSEIVDALDTTP
ncbi:hypothetical protein IT575_14225 [bacterium]|nr:hypothetical protein [bacterium]